MKLKGISKTIAIIAIISTVLKILSSNEKDLGLPMIFLPLSSLSSGNKLKIGFRVNKLNDINYKEKMILAKLKIKQIGIFRFKSLFLTPL